MRSLFLLLSFLISLSPIGALRLRPLVIYTTDFRYGPIAAGSFAGDFNVCLHPVLENCDQLLENVEKEKSECIVIPSSPECGLNIKNKRSHLIRPNSPDFPGWPAIVNNISQISAKPKNFVEEGSCGKKGGVPLWLTVLLAVVASILVLGNIVFVAVYCFKRNKKKLLQENNDDSSKPRTLVPELEKSAKSDEIDVSGKSDTTERSKKSESQERSGTFGLKKKKDNFTIMKRQRSPPKEDDGEGCVMRSDKLNLKAAERAPPLERSKESIRTEPVTASEFDYYLEKIGRFIVDYNDDPTQYNVTSDEPPGFLFQKFSRAAPENPEHFNSLFKFFTSYVMKAVTHWQHPNFHAYFPTGRSYPDMLAELLIASLGVVGNNWESCPAVIEMEMAMINWIGRAIGIPETHIYQDDVSNSVGGGWYLESSSEALLSAVVAATQSKLQFLGDQEKSEGVSHVIQESFVYYASTEASPLIEKVCKPLPGKCRRIPVNEASEWSLTGEQLEQEIQKDTAAGLIPTFVCVTMGAYTTGACDHLKSICEIAKVHNMYVHVDAGFAGMFWIDPKHRPKDNSLEMVNSISSNLDSVLLHSANVTVFFCNDKKLHSEAWSNNMTQLGPWNMGEFRLNNNRRFKALKTWLILGLYGIQALQNHVNRICDLGEYFKSLVAKHPNCKVIGGCHFGVFAFQYTEFGMIQEQTNETTESLLKFMNNSHKTFFSLISLGGRSLIRVGLWYDKGTKTTVDEAWCLVQDLIDEFKQTRNGEVKNNGSDKSKEKSLPPSSEPVPEMITKKM